MYLLSSTKKPCYETILQQLGETESDAVIQSITPFVVCFLLVSLSLAVLFFFGVSGLAKKLFVLISVNHIYHALF